MSKFKLWPKMLEFELQSQNIMTRASIKRKQTIKYQFIPEILILNLTQNPDPIFYPKQIYYILPLFNLESHPEQQPLIKPIFYHKYLTLPENLFDLKYRPYFLTQKQTLVIPLPIHYSYCYFTLNFAQNPNTYLYPKLWHNQKFYSEPNANNKI